MTPKQKTKTEKRARAMAVCDDCGDEVDRADSVHLLDPRTNLPGDLVCDLCFLNRYGTGKRGKH